MTTSTTHSPPDLPHDDGDAGTGESSSGGPAHRRPLRWVAAGLVALVAVLTVTTAIVALGVRTDAEAGRVEMAKGRRALIAGDLDAALDRFEAAEQRFAAGRARAAAGPGGILATIPLLGRSLDVAAGISQAGVTLSAAAGDLTRSIRDLPGGLGALAPGEGRIPVETLVGVATQVQVAAADARSALATVRDTPSSMLPATVVEARFEAEEQIALAARALEAATVLSGRLPTFAGVGGQRRYLLTAESPSEQRATGGIWGAYAILTADDGEISVGPFRPILTLPEARPDQVPPPNPDYRRNYDQYGGAGSWRDMNMTPDFPSAARAALATYELGTGDALDGVIVADPFALQELVRVTGPIEIAPLDVTVNARTLVPFISNEAYIAYPGAGKERKAVLGAVVGAAFERFLAERGDPLDRVRAISRAVGGGHLKIYTTDPAMQRGLRLANLDRGLHAPNGADLLAVHVNSRSANKVDFYAHRTIRYDVLLGGDGEAIATTEVELRNDSPTEGVPGYVIEPGEGVEGHVAGDNVSLVTASCPGPCELIEARRNGRDRAMRVGEELGRHWYQDFYTTPGGTTSTLEIVTRRSGVWQGDSSGGTYRLSVLPQTTIQPTEVTVSIEPPAGTEVVWTSEPMEMHDGRAVWKDEPEGRVELVVRFRAPAPLRWWRNFVRAVG